MTTATAKGLREELIAKRESADRFVKQAKSGGDDSWNLDLVTEGTGKDSEEKAAWLRGMMSEIETLQKAYDAQADLEGKVDLNGEAIEKLRNTNSGSMVHAPAGGGAPGGGFDGGEEAKLWQGKSLGRLFTESDAFKKYRSVEKKGPAVEIEIPEPYFRGLFGMTNPEMKTLLTETGFAPQAVRTGLIVPGALRRPVVADLIPQGTTNQIAIVYMEETTTTNAAAPVSEGGTKQESALAFTQRSRPVQKIATVLPITDELLADEPAMRSYVEARMRLFLALEEEDQILNGNGTPPEITGLFATANTQTYDATGDDIPDAVYHSMILIETNAFLEASGIILNPLDWETVRLMRTTDGIYIWGPPSAPGPDTMWGLPVVRTTAMTQAAGMVAAFDTATQMFRRSEVAFAVSDQHSDFFITNQLMLRVEERFALAVYRPAGIVELSNLGA